MSEPKEFLVVFCNTCKYGYAPGKACMCPKEFTAEIFISTAPDCASLAERANIFLPAILAAHKASWLAELRAKGVRVYRDEKEFAHGEWKEADGIPYPEACTHEGLLIDVREIEK